MFTGEPVRPRRRWYVVTGMAVAALLVAGVAPAALLAGDAARPAVAAAAPPSPSPSATRAPSPTDVARQAINAALKRQSDALLRGDRAGFLAIAQPGDKRLAANLGRRFDSLRALGVAGYVQAVDGQPTGESANRWRTPISIEHCFAARGCALERVKVATGWQVRPDGARMQHITELAVSEGGPLPYEVSSLVAKVGKRTVVATTKRYASRLREAAAMAERAAAAADGFALGGRPERYVIFLAGPKEYGLWYGGAASWSIGFATAAVGSRSDIVLHMEEIDRSYLEDVLRHELTHVSTMGEWDHSSGGSNWWLIEGIADHAQIVGSADEYGMNGLVRRLMNEDDWTGDLTNLSAGDDDADWRVAAKYAVAHLAVRRIAKRFGKDKLMRFLSAVLHYGYTPAGAAPEYLGKSWTNVKADCLRYTRGVVGG